MAVLARTSPARVTLRFDASGRDAPVGHTVTNPAPLVSTAVTVSVAASASVSTTTRMVWASILLKPLLDVGRVSASRRGPTARYAAVVAAACAAVVGMVTPATANSPIDMSCVVSRWMRKFGSVGPGATDSV